MLEADTRFYQPLFQQKKIVPSIHEIVLFLRSIDVHSDTFCTTPESYAILQERIRSIIIRLFENVSLRRDYVPGHRSTDSKPY